MTPTRIPTRGKVRLAWVSAPGEALTGPPIGRRVRKPVATRKSSHQSPSGSVTELSLSSGIARQLIGQLRPFGQPPTGGGSSLRIPISPGDGPPTRAHRG